MNYQSGNIKHHDWNNTSSEFKLSQNFTPTTLSPFRDANFLNMIYSKIEARLEGSFFSGKGDFQFQDPWYALSDNSQPVNYWISGSGMYEPTGKAGATERGIFLNQTPDPNNPNKPYYSVKAISPQSISLNGRIHNFYFLNWGGENVSYEHSNQAETGVVFTDENAVANANMKGTQLSNAVTAYENNSQRKFIRTPDQYYHHVYESMGTVWYERSSDNGQTWYLMNNGMPLELLGNAKSPSIDYLNNENVQCVVITYQRKTSTGSQVVAVIFDNGTRKYTYGLDSFAHPEIEYEEHNAAPVVAISYFSTTDNPQVLFVWKKPGLLPDESYPENEVPALYFSFGYLTRDYYQTSYSLNWHSQNLKKRIPTTDRFSLTPSMAIHKYNFESHFQLAYEQNSQIYYWHCYYVWSAPGALFYGSPENVSSGCGFSSNTKPSIIAANQYFARVCWIGYRNTEPWQNEEGGEGGMPKVGVETEGTEQKVVFCDPDYKDHFWNFGVNVNSTNINKSIPKYVIAWSEGNNNGLIKFTDNTTLGGTINETPNDLTGNYVQVSNAELDIVDMKIMSFNTNAQPFYFNSDQCYSTAKIKSLAIGTGREGVVSKDSARFYFALGDLEVNGQRVDFIEVDDTVSIYSNQRLNDLLISQPFNLNDNTNFVYSVQYGITDSLAAVYVLDNDDFVNFKVELRDNQTEELLGLFDNITYTKINVAQYNNIAYQVNTQGIGNRTVRLKLVTDNNFNPKYSMADRYAQNNALLKTSHKQVSFKGSLAVDNYDLSQNYPNPFNPTTTINYQIKEDGLVTLKLYDILGSEVITLVNEDKTKGRYSYNFNASDLASGVYIYQLRVNDFVSAKKLMLLK